ncbi:MAG: hypothetical protein COC04_00925 [Gammaproteobacteria bacterium]|nr:MAG: hypothetical protein COC04_00925 [Gammaproteobacteria bacterium]
MFYHLPSLQVLRSFEAAARHLSFKSAANELFVTPSAISHQVKTLEQQLGIDLFTRNNRKISLTKNGKEYFYAVNDALSIILSATNDLTQPIPNTLHLHTIPFLATELFLPSLKLFKENFPDIELKIETSTKSANFATADADIALQIEPVALPGVICDELTSIIVTAVCAPSFLEENRITCFEDVLDYPLIHNSFRDKDWFKLAEKYDYRLKAKQSDLWFNSIQASIQAAEDGLGFALMDMRYIVKRVDSHRLVAPFAIELELGSKLHFICRENIIDTPEITAIRRWLNNILA